MEGLQGYQKKVIWDEISSFLFCPDRQNQKMFYITGEGFGDEIRAFLNSVSGMKQITPFHGMWLGNIIEASMEPFLLFDARNINQEEQDYMYLACRGMRHTIRGKMILLFPHHPWWINTFEQASRGCHLQLNFEL